MRASSFSLWRVASMALGVAMFAGACADEDLDVAASSADARMTLPGVAAGAPTSIVAGAEGTASTVSVVRLTPSMGPLREHLPVFYRYQAREGDTVASVAELFRIRPEYVAWNNEGVLAGDELVVGSLLDIPSVEGIIHRMQLGETLSEIAARLGVEAQAIIDFPANGISSPTLGPSSTLLIPGGRKP